MAASWTKWPAQVASCAVAARFVVLAAALAPLVFAAAPAHGYVLDCPGGSAFESDKGELDRVIKECTAAITENLNDFRSDDPKYALRFLAEGYHNRAEAYLRKRQFILAINDADQCVAAFEKYNKTLDAPYNDPVYRNQCPFIKGRALVALKRYDDAIATFQKAFQWEIEREGESLHSTNYIHAFGCRNFMHPDEESFHCDQNLESAYEERAKLRVAKKDFSGAIADYKAILELYRLDDDHLPWAYVVVGLASAYEQAGDLIKAEEVYTGYMAQYINSIARYIKYRVPATLEADRTHSEVHFLRGRLRLARGDFEHAFEDFDAAVRYDPNQSEYRIGRAKAEFALSKLDAALEDFNSIIGSAPTASIYAMRASVFQANGNLDAALSDLNEAIKLDAKSDPYYFQRSLVRAAKDQLAEAISDLDMAIRLDPKNPEYVATRGMLNDVRGSFDKALADYAQAARLDPKNAQPYVLRAWAFLKAGRMQAGLEDANRALKLAPTSASAFAARGHLYEALGRKTDAIQDYKRALANEPEMQDARGALVRLGAQ